MKTEQAPSLPDAVRVWARIGLLSFGGPAAQIALMHREVVEERGWLSEKRFLDTVSFCMLLPGPEAMQIATYIGWRLHGVWGGIVAGCLFVLPGATIIMVLAALYVAFGHMPLVRAGFLGVQAAVIGIVLKAMIGLMGRALNGAVHWMLAVFGFVALFAFNLPFPLVIAGAALAGAILCNTGAREPAPAGSAPPRTLQTLSIWGSLWATPLLILWITVPDGMALQISLFFSKLAIVTFGGAYAVLTYMSQQVVQDFGWITTEQMIDALGLAETTPGPLILVTQFVGFLAGAGDGGIWHGLIAALLALWVTFIPCFLWIFVAAPYVERILAQPRLAGALAGITAAVVGVIANLSLWFGLHVLFGVVSQVDAGIARFWVPNVTTFKPGAAAVAALAIIALFWLRWSLVRVLFLSAGLAVIGATLR